MSEVLTEHEQETERAARPVAIRRYETEIVAGDGRTASFRIAPFGEIATSADGLGGVPKGVPYQEELMPGMYAKQIKAANRILLNFEHQPGIAGVVGHGLELREQRDGYHAAFRVHDYSDGDKALSLIKAGVLGAASVESYWLKSVRAASGVIQRVKAHLDAVAVCRQGAYPSAVLTGIRGDELEDEIIMDEAFLPVPFDPELADRCRLLGVKLPERYKAHPVETGTPAETGTPEAAPALDPEEPTSEV